LREKEHYGGEIDSVTGVVPAPGPAHPRARRAGAADVSSAASAAPAVRKPGGNRGDEQKGRRHGRTRRRAGRRAGPGTRGRAGRARHRAAAGAGPGAGVFDAAGFIQELQAKLKDNVAGYSIGLNENGSTIGQANGGLAKWPIDGFEAEAWTLDTRTNVASLSKIVTAIAMTKLLGEAGISPGTPIIGYLPAYWVKGPNVGYITFADLLAHTRVLTGFTGLSGWDMRSSGW
jgi:Beta-lactamase